MHRGCFFSYRIDANPMDFLFQFSVFCFIFWGFFLYGIYTHLLGEPTGRPAYFYLPLSGIIVNTGIAAAILEYFIYISCHWFVLVIHAYRTGITRVEAPQKKL